MLTKRTLPHARMAPARGTRSGSLALRDSPRTEVNEVEVAGQAVLDDDRTEIDVFFAGLVEDFGDDALRLLAVGVGISG